MFLIPQKDIKEAATLPAVGTNQTLMSHTSLPPWRREKKKKKTADVSEAPL